MSRHESHLKSALIKIVKEQLQGCVLLRHEDVRTAGIPDFSLTVHARTTWWECKHGVPQFDSIGIQELTMLRLASAGFARYIVWQEQADGTAKRTLIVHPTHLKALEPDVWCTGYNHAFVVEYMWKAHGL